MTIRDCRPRLHCINSTGIAIAAMLTLATITSAQSQIVLQQPIDVLLEGDDPGETFTFDLPLNRTTPSTLRFDGFFQNLASDETGVRYIYHWPIPDGGGQELFSTEFQRLPASGQLPIQFTQPIDFTPDNISLIVQGGGPSDHFRFVGTVTVEQVPEPQSGTLFGAGAIAGMLSWRFRRTVTI